MSSDTTLIEVALNGATTKAANPHVPRTPAEITADALACIEAGAAIVHNHNDEPMWVPTASTPPSPTSRRGRRSSAPTRTSCSTPPRPAAGQGSRSRRAGRTTRHSPRLTPLALVDPGSVSLGGDAVYINSHADAHYGFERCAALGLAPSVSIFDPSFLRVALAAELPAGALIKLYFGDRLLFGLPPTEASLDAYLAMLEGSGLPWLVAVLGGDVIGCGLARLALERGGHLRVGLEDYAGERTPSNVELVQEAAALIERSGRRVASAREARALLGLQPPA